MYTYIHKKQKSEKNRIRSFMVQTMYQNYVDKLEETKVGETAVRDNSVFSSMPMEP